MKCVYIILVSFVFAFAANGQEKHGYIIYDSAVKVHPDYALYEKELKTLYTQLEDTLRIYEKDYNHFLESGIPHNTKADSLMRKALQDTLRNMEERMVKYQQYVQDKLWKVNEVIAKDLKNKITVMAEAFRKENSIACLADKDALLYCPDCIDYTEEFKKYLRKEK